MEVMVVVAMSIPEWTWRLVAQARRHCSAFNLIALSLQDLLGAHMLVWAHTHILVKS
jgi:hypothetical protein